MNLSYTWILLIIIASYHTSLGKWKSYRGYVRYHIQCTDPKLRLKLKYLLDHPELDIWRFAQDRNSTIDVVAAPKGVKYLDKQLKTLNITSYDADISLGRRVYQHMKENEDAFRNGKRVPRATRRKRKLHTFYLKFYDMKRIFRRLAKKFNHIQYEEIGYTVEGRPLIVLRFAKNRTAPAVWIDAGIHAREWIAPASAIYFIDYLLSPVGADLLNNFQWFIMPMVNPDGYVFSHESSRLWRKNRRSMKTSECKGVDLNRNFPVMWKRSGSSDDPCSDTYHGHRAGSELETFSIMRKLKEINDEYNFSLYLSLHSFGQYLLTSYGYQALLYPPNHAKLMKVGLQVTDALSKKFAAKYQCGSASDLLYEASGGADDYVTETFKINYSYTIELADQGRHGFVLPPGYIPIVGHQLIEAVRIMSKNIS